MQSDYVPKQAPRAWYQELHNLLLQLGFTNTNTDSLLFILKLPGHVIYIVVYKGDLIITDDDANLVTSIIEQLAHRFSLKDFGKLSYFLGVEVVHNKYGILLSQRMYILDLLAKTNMTKSKPMLTPLPTSPMLVLKSGTLLSDPAKYRKIVYSLQ